MTITDEELAEWEALCSTDSIIPDDEREDLVFYAVKNFARLIAEVRALRGDFDTEVVAAEEYRQILHKKIEEQRQEIERADKRIAELEGKEEQRKQLIREVM